MITRHVTLLLLCVIGAMPVSAQLNTFQISYDIGLLDLMGSVQQLPNDNYIVGGSAGQGLFPIPNATLMEVSDVGSVVWARSYGFGFFNASTVDDARRTSDGGFIAAGSGPNSGGQAMLMKTNATGATVTWARGYGGSRAESFNRVRQTADGGYIAIGTTRSFGSKDSTNIYIVKANANGSMAWDRAIVADPGRDMTDGANDIIEVPGDGFYGTGFMSQLNGADTTRNILLFKLNTSGVVQWIRSYGALNRSEQGYSIELLPSNELLVTGSTTASSSGTDASDAFVMRTDLSGNIQWCHAYHVGFEDISNNGQRLADGNYASIGWTITNLFPLSIAAYVVKMNSTTGAVMFAERYTVGIGNILGEGMQTSDGGFILAGMTGNTSWDFHLIKTDGAAQSGCNQASFGAVQRAFSPAMSTPTPAYYNGGSTTNYSPSVSTITPAPIINCIDVVCDPPPAPTVSASPTSICQGASSSISASGSGSGVTYNVYTVASGGTSIGTAPMSVSPASTTTYYVEAIDELNCVSDRVPIEVTVIPAADPSWTSPGAVCESGGNINLTPLVTGTAGGTFTGPGVSGNVFNPVTAGGGTHTITYTVGTAPCEQTQQHNITVTDQTDPTWTSPGTVCMAAGTIDLSTLVTGTPGGTFTGPGVSGGIFDPSVAGPGQHIITYTVGQPPCQETLDRGIEVIPAADPAWTTATLCADGSPIDLNTLVTGTAGGNWTGVGITGSIFNPASVGAGNHAVTYTVGQPPCEETLTQDILVEPAADASWTAPTVACAATGAIDLDALVTGTAGGTWSGTGVTGSTFDPVAAGSGTHTITYTVGNAPCEDISAQDITVEPVVSADWTSPGTVCDADGTINLDALLTGDTGALGAAAGSQAAVSIRAAFQAPLT